MMDLLLFGIVSLLASTLSGASGGGGGLISTPLMAVLGLPPATAIATAKFGGFGTSLGASFRFNKEKIASPRIVLLFSVIGGIGAILGSLLLIHFSSHEAALERIMGFTVLFVGVPLLYARNMGVTARKPTKTLQIIGGVLLGIGVLVQVALGSGIGSLQMIVLMGCFGMTAIVASATRRAMQLSVATISLGIYIAAGLIDYRFGLVSLATTLIGGYIGAHLAVKKGNKFVVNLFALTSALLAFQLIF